MKAADIPQTNNSTVEVQPFCFEYPLTETIADLTTGTRVIDTGILIVRGWAYRKPHLVDGTPDISVDVQWVTLNRVDVKKLLVHFRVMDQIEAFAQKKAEKETFAPTPTKENTLKAIIDTVYSIKGHHTLSITGTSITVRLSDMDNDVVFVGGLEVTKEGQLIVYQDNGEGWPLNTTDARAEKMIAGIYKGLEKRFPNQIKAIA